MFATPETAELLINSGADINTVNFFGYTPLRFFKESSLEKMVSILEKAGSKGVSEQVSTPEKEVDWAIGLLNSVPQQT